MYTILFLTLAISTPDDDARAALALAQSAKPVVKAEQLSAYDEAYVEARKRSMALVVFVNTKGRKISSVVTVEVKELNNSKEPRIVVAKPGTGYTVTATIDATSNDVEILLAIAGRKVQPSAVPFEAKRFNLLTRGKRARPDDDLSGYGPWPKEVAKIDGLVHYAPSRYTQRIFNRGEGPQGTSLIQPVDRASLPDARWHQSGGMLGLEGWRSDLYKYVPERMLHERKTISVENSSGDFQTEWSWQRSYPDGTVFMDVLSNQASGKVFSHRVRTKNNGQWKSREVYRDEAEYPVGYVGLKQSCSSCHDETGTGGYAVGLVPGGDTVFSDPLPVEFGGDRFGGM